MSKPTILIVEDDPHMRAALEASLKKGGYCVETAEDVPQADEKVREKTYGLILTDLRMPNGSGIEVIKKARAVRPDTPVIVITAYGTVDVAVEAMKEGAVDFIQKPFSFEELHQAVNQSVNDFAAFEESSPDGNNGGIVSRDPGMIQLLKRAQIVANSKATVMIQGESGTGKELLARYIHSMSPRGGKPLVAINCAAIPENLLESELFGHEKGAFTGANSRKIGKFEQAEGSTLLLDEIGEMNLALQAKLLRVLQEWQVDRVGGKDPIPVDIRVIATTNADLSQGVKDGKFREDLYFRLNVVPLTLPPLRDRRSDITILAQEFLTKSALANGKEIKGFKPEALKALSEHVWKGNIRELKNVVELAVILAEGPFLDVTDFGLEGREAPESENENGIGVLDGSVKEVERELILQTLKREDWNRTRASRKLGISIRTLRNKLQEYRREGFLPAGVEGE